MLNSEKRCFIICPNPSIDIMATIDNIFPQYANRIKQEKRFPGGKGIHVALALSEMGIPTTLVGIWGSDNGAWISDACKRLYPDLQIMGPIVDGWNRSCYTLRSSPEWKDTEILGTGPLINDSHFNAVMDVLNENLDQMANIAICGSWPLGAHPKNNKNIIEWAKSHDIDSFLDCTGEQLKYALEKEPYCVHLNKTETETYFNLPFDEAINKVNDYCELAAITAGSKGLYLQSKEQRVHANVNITDVKSTVGSGECLLAGIIAGHYMKDDFYKITKLGVACGAANCLNENLGMLKLQDVERLVEQVKFYNLN